MVLLPSALITWKVFMLHMSSSISLASGSKVSIRRQLWTTNANMMFVYLDKCSIPNVSVHDISVRVFLGLKLTLCIHVQPKFTQNLHTFKLSFHLFPTCAKFVNIHPSASQYLASNTNLSNVTSKVLGA